MLLLKLYFPTLDAFLTFIIIPHSKAVAEHMLSKMDFMMTKKQCS